MRETPPYFFEMSRLLDAPRQRVYAAFTDPARVTTWWAPKGWYTPQVEMDVRVGGKYRFQMKSEADDSLLYVHGEYLVVEPAKRLVFTHIWESEGAGEAMWSGHQLIERTTTVTVEFRDHGQMTMLKIQHEGFPTQAGSEGHRLGWSSNTDCLEEFLHGTVKAHARQSKAAG